jgi:hypothetical protein
MEKNTQQSRILVLASALSILFVCSAAFGQDKDKPKPPVLTKPLAEYSDNDLLKYGEQYQKAGELPKAREALTLGLDNLAKKKKKPDAKYPDILKQINEKLADDQAATGEAACKRMDLPACEKQIAAAREFATTARVTALSNLFNKSVSDLQRQLQDAQKLAASGDYENALRRMKDLTKYVSNLPTINSEIDKTTKAYVQKLLQDASNSIDQKSWESASQQYQRVLELDANNQSAKSGISLIQKARSAFDLQTRALTQSSTRKFDDALKSIDLAMATYPLAEFERTKTSIMRDYVSYLAAPIPTMVSGANDFTTTRDVYLRLDQVKQFDPENEAVKKYLPEVTDNFGTNVLQRALDLENIVDYSRIGTAYLMKVNAQRRLGSSIVKPEDIKTAATAFKNKRASQVVLSVENLSTNLAAASFRGPLETRARHTLETIAPQDTRICMSDDKKCLIDDPQFESLRPDSKSRTASLTITIAKYDFTRTHSDTASVKSQYVNGTEDYPNPEYKQREAELDQMRRALDRPDRKKDKPTPEGWTEATFGQKQRELDKTDKALKRDRILDYSYSKTAYTQSTNVELSVELRDYMTRESLKRDTIRSNKPPIQAEEIEGVKDADKNNLQNKRLKLPDKEESLDEAGTIVSEELERKIQETLPVYTNRFFNEGEKRMKANQVDEAVEAYICHFAFMKGRMSPAQLDRVSDVVKTQTGFDLKRDGDIFLASLD